MNLFIDTNMYLSFYRYSSDDLDELRKLAVAVKSGDITLFTTSQLRDEFKRNRETVIAFSLRSLQDLKLPNKFPQMVINYSHYSTLRGALKEYGQTLNLLMDDIRRDALENRLHADEILKELFPLTQEIKVTSQIINDGKQRFDLGNPPGKDKSYGDAVNWTALLEKIPDGEDLYIISSDGDYASKIDENILSEFLKEEWGTKKGSTVKLYSSFTAFFRERYPKIKLAVELEKEMVIRRFIQSGSFASTHSAVARLNQYPEFSPEQVRAIIEGAMTNRQIYWISTDDDVNFFINSLLDRYQSLFDGTELNQISEVYAHTENEDLYADIPF